ncbi:MAG TPA: 50S ribosomal protein L4 [Candidatus Fraserbacteria bacterium]|nr:50S ribosomal protein L4 [Candidatus Fraserbacteria bacterium]
MAKARLVSLNGEERQIELSDSLVGRAPNRDLLHRCVQQQLTLRRAGTACTKTRGGVTGGHKKPWTQKHTGRARHGSKVSNIWRGGGVAFGPKPKRYTYRLPKKMRRLGLAMALTARYREGQLAVIDQLDFEKPKTKAALQLLEHLGFPPQHKVLIIVAGKEGSEAVRLSFRNLPQAQCLPVAGANIYDILKYESLVISQGALAELERRVALDAK